MVKARPRRILAMTAAFVVPAQLLAAFLQRNAVGGFGVADVFTDDPTVLDEQVDSTRRLTAGRPVLVLVIPAVALVCVAAAIAHLVTSGRWAATPAAGEMLGVVGRRWWPLLGSFVLVKLAEAVGAASAATSASRS